MTIQRGLDRRLSHILRAPAALICLVLLLAWVGPAPAAESSFLWSLENDAGRTYIMGSIHILKNESYPMPQAYRSAYEDSSAIVFETDPSGMTDPAMQSRIMDLALFPQGESARDYLSGDVYQALTEKLASMGLEPSRFDRFKPWFTALNLAMMEVQRLGYDPGLGVDAYFLELAAKDEKEILYLEPAERQIRLLASMNRDEQEKFLLQSLQEMEVLAERADDMIRAWEKGDASALEETNKRGYEGFPDLYQRFIVERNNRWIPDIQSLFDRHGNTLVIVGAGHLVGDQGMIRLLEKKGYQLDQH